MLCLDRVDDQKITRQNEVLKLPALLKETAAKEITLFSLQHLCPGNEECMRRSQVAV